MVLVLSLVPLFAMRGVPVPDSAQAWNVANVANTIEALGVCALGILIGVRRPTNRVGWVFLVAGAALAILNLSQDYAPVRVGGRPRASLGGEGGGVPRGRGLADPDRDADPPAPAVPHG